LNYHCTCTRCGGTGEGVTVQQAKFSCHHKVGCGRKIGILNWDDRPTLTSAKVAKEILQELEPVPEVTEKPKKKKKKKKKVEE